MKSNNAEISDRVATVAQMLITGQNRQDIVQYGSKQWSITVRQVDEYIAKANAMIAELHQQDVDYYRKLLLARLEDLYHRNFVIQDYREGRQVLQDIAKLIGANAPDKTDLTTGGEKLTMPKFVLDEANSEKPD